MSVQRGLSGPQAWRRCLTRVKTVQPERAEDGTLGHAGREENVFGRSHLGRLSGDTVI